MAILKMLRVSMHPFNWWVIVKRAIDAYKPEKQGMDLRRKLAEINKALDAKLLPDEAVVENPYAKFVTKELELRRKRNAEIEAECAKTGEDPRQVEAVIEGTGPTARVVQRGWQALPNPDLRELVDLTKEQVRIIKDAVEKYSESEISHSIDQGFVDVMDALEGPEEVEIDTERVNAPKLVSDA